MTTLADIRPLLRERLIALHAAGVRVLSAPLLERTLIDVAARAVALDDQRLTTLAVARAALREVDTTALWRECAATNCFAFA